MSMKFRPIFAIAGVTAREILREKVLYNTFILGLLLLAASFAAGRLTFIKPERVVLDFGVFSMSFLGALLGALHGSSLINREIERRTWAVALSRPIRMGQFVSGKYLGFLSVIAVNFILLGAIELGMFKMMGGDLGVIHFYSAYLLFLQSAFFGALTILFSTLTTTGLSVFLSLGVYLVGNSAAELLSLVRQIDDSVFKNILLGLAYLVPNLEHFHLGFDLTYDLPVAFLRIALATLYAILWIAVALGIASHRAYQKEVV